MKKKQIAIAAASSPAAAAKDTMSTIPVFTFKKSRIIDSKIEVPVMSLGDSDLPPGESTGSLYKERIAQIAAIINGSTRRKDTFIKITAIISRNVKLHCYMNEQDLYITCYSIEKKLADSSESTPIYTIRKGDEKYPNTFKKVNIFPIFDRINRLSSKADWIQQYNTSSYNDSTHLIHTLGVYIAEATRFLPVRALIANSIDRSREVNLTNTVVTNSGKSMLMKSYPVHRDTLATYDLLIHSWQQLSATTPDHKATRIFDKTTRTDSTDKIVDVRHPDFAILKGKYTSGPVSNTNTPDRGGAAAISAENGTAADSSADTAPIELDMAGLLTIGMRVVTPPRRRPTTSDIAAKSVAAESVAAEFVLNPFHIGTGYAKRRSSTSFGNKIADEKAAPPDAAGPELLSARARTTQKVGSPPRPAAAPPRLVRKASLTFELRVVKNELGSPKDDELRVPSLAAAAAAAPTEAKPVLGSFTSAESGRRIPNPKPHPKPCVFIEKEEAVDEIMPASAIDTVSRKLEAATLFTKGIKAATPPRAVAAAGAESALNPFHIGTGYARRRSSTSFGNKIVDEKAAPPCLSREASLLAELEDDFAITGSPKDDELRAPRLAAASAAAATEAKPVLGSFTAMITSRAERPPTPHEWSL